MEPRPPDPHTDLIDRVAPTKRCAGRPAGYQHWRSLLFMHWPVPIDMLRPLVPRELELDLFDGRAYVGIVPFVMEGIRPWWCPRRWGFHFLETNVRTYVLHRHRPGVYFFSLEASSRIAVKTARAFWGLPYHYAQMSMRKTETCTTYTSRRAPGGDAFSVRYRVGPSLGPALPDSQAFFFLERYLLFVERDDSIACGQVCHTPYPAHSAVIEEVDDQLVSAAGLPPVRGLPEFAHFSPGVDVEVFPLRSASPKSP